MITVIAVGKIKERYLREGIDDYLKRLTRFGKTEIIEIAEENCDVNPALAVSAEGKKMADRIPKGAYLIGLDVQGKQWTSEDFPKKSSLCSLRETATSVFSSAVPADYPRKSKPAATN
jgi:23S rRNA (pseudouridine1915-N3)-methyltransferase